MIVVRSLVKSKFLLLETSLALGWFFVQATLAPAAIFEKVRVGYSIGGLIPFPAVIARENRFFEQMGLELELINIPPAADRSQGHVPLGIYSRFFEKATWSENGLASEQALQIGIEESLKVHSSKQAVPLSRIADFSFAGDAYRDITAK